MQTANRDFVIAQATDERQEHAIGKAIANAVEVGTIFPSKLRTELEGAGYRLVDDKVAVSDYGFASAKFLKRVLVLDKAGTIVAMGAAVDPDEAILAAVLGWTRENALPDSEVPEGLAEAPTAQAQTVN